MPIDESDSDVRIVRVTQDPDIQGGDYCIAGTRITVSSLIEAQAEGMTLEEIAASIERRYGLPVTAAILEEVIGSYEVLTRSDWTYLR